MLLASERHESVRIGYQSCVVVPAVRVTRAARRSSVARDDLMRIFGRNGLKVATRLLERRQKAIVHPLGERSRSKRAQAKVEGRNLTFATAV